MLTGFGTKPDFFRFGLVRLLTRLLVLLVFEFAEVHDSANRWPFVGCDLNEIQIGLACAVQSFVESDYSVLSSIWANDAKWRNADLAIDPCLNAFDRDAPL